MMSQAEIIKKIKVLEPNLDIEVLVANKDALMMILNGAEVERNNIIKNLAKVSLDIEEQTYDKLSNEEIRNILAKKLKFKSL